MDISIRYELLLLWKCIQLLFSVVLGSPQHRAFYLPLHYRFQQRIIVGDGPAEQNVSEGEPSSKGKTQGYLWKEYDFDHCDDTAQK